MSHYIIIEQKWNQIGRAVQEEGFRPNGKREIVIYPKIMYDNTIPSQVGREIHRSRSWASKSKWCRRYIQECTNGLNDKSRSGRPSSKLPEEIAFLIQNELLECKQAGLEYY